MERRPSEENIQLSMYRTAVAPGRDPNKFIKTKGNKPFSFPLSASLDPAQDWWQADHEARRAIIEPHMREELRRKWEEVDKGNLIPTNIVPRADIETRQGLSETYVMQTDDDHVWTETEPPVRERHEMMWDTVYDIHKAIEVMQRQAQAAAATGDDRKVKMLQGSINNAQHQLKYHKAKLEAQTRRLDWAAAGGPKQDSGRRIMQARHEERLIVPAIATVPTRVVPGAYPRELTPAELAILNPPHKLQVKAAAEPCPPISNRPPPQPTRRVAEPLLPSPPKSTPPASKKRFDSGMETHSPASFHGVYREPTCTMR